MHSKRQVWQEKSRTFSSPMVNWPWVRWCCSVNAWSLLIGSLWEIVAQNLTFDFVYSCPGCSQRVSDEEITRGRRRDTYENLGIIRKRSKDFIQRPVHFLCCPLKKSSASYAVESAPEPKDSILHHRVFELKAYLR